jgi:DNA-binding transcriptional MerR regulator
MEKEKYLINELAKMAGVTVRTIRYYTDEGLLPQPIIHGKYAYYNDDHLRRLELIRQMKDAFLPLREIRQTLKALSEDEVVQKLKNQNTGIVQQQVVQPAASATEPGKSARDYIERIMERQSGFRTLAQTVPPLPSSSTRSKAPAQSSLTDENWRRIELAPGIELHIREHSHSWDAQTIQQLKEYIHNLIQAK